MMSYVASIEDRNSLVGAGHRERRVLPVTQHVLHPGEGRGKITGPQEAQPRFEREAKKYPYTPAHRALRAPPPSSQGQKIQAEPDNLPLCAAGPGHGWPWPSRGDPQGRQSQGTDLAGCSPSLDMPCSLCSLCARCPEDPWAKPGQAVGGAALADAIWSASRACVQVAGWALRAVRSVPLRNNVRRFLEAS